MRDAAAIVLAGGRSERFGSDKALAPFRGEPLLAHALRGVRAEFGEVLVVAKRAEKVDEDWVACDYGTLNSETRKFGGASS